MNDTTPLSADPRLTAYALGELDPDERATIEAALQSDPAAQEVVRQIRAVSAQLETALAGELAELSKAEASAAALPSGTGLPTRETNSEAPSRVGRPVLRENAETVPEYTARHETSGWGRLIRFPQFYFVISSAAAVAFAIMMIWRQPEFEAKARADAALLRVAQEQRMQARENARASAAAEQVALAMAVDATAAAELPAARAAQNFMGPVAPMPASTGPAARGATSPDRAEPVSRPAAAKVARSVRTLAVASPALAENPFVPARQEPASSFAVNVGTRSYPEVRQTLREGRLPPAEAVRIEEWVNYFPYQYERPAQDAPAPLKAAIEVAEAPWAPGHRLVRVGLQARDGGGQVRGEVAVVARDVALEVEFNPATVASYRLIGYESGTPAANDATPSSGADLRAGQTVTALYELVPAHEAVTPATAAEGLKYQSRAGEMVADIARELLTLKVTFRDPDGGSRKLEFPVVDSGGGFRDATADFKFAAAVANFGMQLRRSQYRGVSGFGDVIEWASSGLRTPAEDPAGLRGEFVGLVRQAQALWH